MEKEKVERRVDTMNGMRGLISESGNDESALKKPEALPSKSPMERKMPSLAFAKNRTMIVSYMHDRESDLSKKNFESLACHERVFHWGNKDCRVGKRNWRERRDRDYEPERQRRVIYQDRM